jgi:hypothetical protein
MTSSISIVTRYADDRLQVMFGDGTVGYRSVRVYPTLSKPQGVTAGDFNHDGTIDVAVALVSGRVSVYAIRPDGSYQRRDLSAPNATYNVITAGDFDRDGWIDLAAASSSNQIVALFRGSAAGWRYYGAALTTWSPRGIEAADLNQDGWLDLVTGDRAASHVSVLVGRTDGSGLFDSVHVPAGSGSRAVAVADFDGNGLPDIAAANEYAKPATVLNNTTPLVPPAFAFERRPVEGMSNLAAVLAVADFNRNGRLDLVVAGAAILDGTSVLPMFGEYAKAATIGDFNDDGHPDVAVSDGPGIRTYLSDGRDFFTAGGGTGPVSTYYAFSILRTADVNRDGRADVVAAFTNHQGGGEIVVLLGNGDGTFSLGRTLYGAATMDLEVADVNRDGRIDIVTAADGSVHVWLGDGAGNFADRFPISLEAHIRDLAVGDLNEDGAVDIAAFDGERLIVRVLTGNGDGTFFPAGEFPATGRRGAPAGSG